MPDLSTKQWVMDDISSLTAFDLTTGDVALYSDKLKKATITIDAKQAREYGGTSKYSFHLTEQDAESAVQIENAVFDFNQLAAATGASLSVGAVVRPKSEKHTVDASAGTITLSKAASMVDGSEKVYVATKGLTNSGVKLERVASAPTAAQYSIATGVITFGDTSLKGKDVRVFYDYTTAATAERASIKTTTKNKPYKIVLEGSYFDDELNERFNATFIFFKAQMLGTFTADQQRKTATTNTLDLAILDPQRADGMAIDIITD